MNAVFSACGTYRHLLDEPGEHQCAIVMLNPSKAGSVDAAGVTISDPTANRVREFRKSWGYSGHIIVNAYDKVSTDPKQLWSGAPPCSPDADAYLMAAATLPLIVVAWGRHAKRERVLQVQRILQAFGGELYCWGVNEDGSPKHPLYLSYKTKLQRWPGIDGLVNV